MSAGRGIIEYGGRQIAFALRHADRETLRISVDPTGAVDVVAPIGTPYDDVHARLVRRARWIVAQQEYFGQFAPRTPPRRHVSGETHLYLGRQYRLKVEEGQREGVKLTGGRFVVTVSGERSPERVEALLGRWYRVKAEERLREWFDACWSGFRRSQLEHPPQLRIRRMRTRWGSMSSGGVLTLNVDLVRAPRDCIDYVIIHELCHLEFPDHGNGFRTRLEHALPDWKKRKHRLELTLA
jgi:hypothetical protein